MSDSYQTIVDVEATSGQATTLAEIVPDWLVAHGILLAGQGNTDPGPGDHAPGPAYHRVVADSLSRNRPDGMEVITGRNVFQSDVAEHIVCPHCATTTTLVANDGDPTEAWIELSNTIGNWYEGGDDTYQCGRCAKSVRLNEWRWFPPWGFGHLGFRFWNWPELDDAFVSELSRLLDHRVVHTYGKL